MTYIDYSNYTERCETKRELYNDALWKSMRIAMLFIAIGSVALYFEFYVVSYIVLAIAIGSYVDVVSNGQMREQLESQMDLAEFVNQSMNSLEHIRKRESELEQFRDS